MILASQNSIAKCLPLGVLAILGAMAISNTAAADVSDEALRQSGIRRLDSRHLTLYTDLPAKADVEKLPEQFDQAYPQWCRYFGVPEEQNPPWHVSACLMRDAERFKRTGLLPEGVPAFRHGYTIDNRFWLNEQPSDYYRRHLLLHEGTHAFMFTRLGSCGPAWYMEGIAEFLATHRLDGDRVTLGYFPVDREEVPFWGRIKLIHDAQRDGKQLGLEPLMAMSYRELPDLLGYAWTWGAAAFLDGHPAYRDRFRQADKFVKDREFNGRIRALYGDEWPAVCGEFALFLHELEFGYDFERTQLDWKPGIPLAASGQSAKIRADRGWQNTGIELEAGRDYELRASGRYRVGDKPQTWWCEPGGVTLRYYRGRPLGELMAVVVPSADEAAIDPPWSEATPIGLAGKISPNRSGTLFLRVNDSAAELADNAGEIEVEVHERP